MQPKHLNLQILSEQVDLHSFNCGDEDLNDFLINNAYQSMMHRMSLTYILKENEQVLILVCSLIKYQRKILGIRLLLLNLKVIKGSLWKVRTLKVIRH